jgi:hypothetical protein
MNSDPNPNPNIDLESQLLFPETESVSESESDSDSEPLDNFCTIIFKLSMIIFACITIFIVLFYLYEFFNWLATKT